MPPVYLARERALYGAPTERQLPTLRRDLARLQEQLSTGRRVNRASDDPGAFEQARALESLERRYAGFERSVSAARLWSDTTQDALDGLVERFMEAHEKGLAGLNDTLSTEERTALADQIDGLLDEVVDGLNTRAGDEYVFAGNRTGSAPVDAAGAATGDLSGERVRRLAPGVELAVNVPGSDVLATGQGFTITEALTDLSAALRGEPGAQPLDDAVGQVETARDHLVRTGSRAGGIGRRLGLVETQLADAQLRVAGRRSEVEDADLFDVASRLQQTQAALEATLRTVGSTLRTSLVDYLR